MQSVAKHLCYNQSFYNEQLSFWNDKENHFYQVFFWIYTSNTHKIQALKGLQKKCFQSDIIFRHCVKMPPIKFWKRLTNCMMSISLSEKFCCQNLITSIEVINQHYWTLEQIELIEKYKHHRMSNEEHHHLEMENSQYQNQNHLVYH